MRSDSMRTAASLIDDEDNFDVALSAHWANSPRTASRRQQALLDCALPLSPRPRHGARPDVHACDRMYTVYGPSRCGELEAAEAQDAAELGAYSFIAAALGCDEPLTMRSAELAAHVAGAKAAAAGCAATAAAQQASLLGGVAHGRAAAALAVAACCDPAGRLLRWVDKLAGAARR